MDGGTEEVRRLLGEEVDIEAKGGMNAGTPLHVACSYGRVEVLLLLIDHGADVSFTDIHGRSPLHAAAIQGDLPFSRRRTPSWACSLEREIRRERERERGAS